MNEIEQKVYTAISEIKRLLVPMVDNVEDNEEIRWSTTALSDQLQKVVGRRIIKESMKKNG